MNAVSLTGRLTKDVEFSYKGETAIARYTLAVDRKFKKDEADFIRCVAFGKTAEFADKWFRKGMKVEVCGRIQTGSYTAQDGSKRYTTDVVVEEQGFGESKAETSAQSVTEDFSDATQAELPFN